MCRCPILCLGRLFFSDEGVGGAGGVDGEVGHSRGDSLPVVWVWRKAC